jgi:hypothetical protein
MLILIVKSFGSTNKGVDRVHSKYLCTIDIEYMLYKKMNLVKFNIVEKGGSTGEREIQTPGACG